ncbi:MAG: 2-C-methyl-D-erythritol 2,4-cyclodiphosphate synthase [Balneolales bacterium]|nr:2-C-methyl-D-erythritol 2,4-cyclodiphosphate synthase [Balneolales bacterium]
MIDDIRTGLGYDVHQLVSGRKLIIGGVEIDYEMGLLGHSDADVLLHAINDALLGALALGDIGTHFPDTDERWKGADSKKLLSTSLQMVKDRGFRVLNTDATIIAEKPKMKPFIPLMQQIISGLLEVDIDRVSIKATTSEKMGFVGRKEGIAAMATILVAK